VSTNPIDPYNAAVVGREEINPQLLILRVRPAGNLFQFTAGQFGVLGLLAGAPRVAETAPEVPPPDPGKLIRRAYSLSSSSLERRYAEFFITLVPTGQLTPRLFVLKHGSRLYLGPKASGLFTLDKVAPEKAVVLIGTGTGLAPYVSMLRTMLAGGSRRKYVVLHGTRYSWDLGYRGELESLARLCPNFTYIPSITRRDQDPAFLGYIGRIPMLLEQGIVEKESGVVLDPAKTEVFLCGNPEMIQAVTTLLQARGFAAKGDNGSVNIHVEEYW
jgi:ferredoxin--NADP+ reductase